MNNRVRIPMSALATVVALICVVASQANGTAQQNNTSPNTGTKPPPLPLHQIEGNGGVFSTFSAYLVNPPRNGEPIGRPSIGFGYINIGYGRDLVALTVTETPWERLELGLGYNLLNLGDLPAVIAAGGGPVIDQTLALYHANVRLQVLQEGQFELKWMPAVTLSAHVKYNDGINRINERLGGVLDAIGLTDDSSWDFTLYASKMLTFMPRPVLVNLGGRATESAQLGLLGFTDDYSFVFEASVVVLATDWLMFAAEFKQQPGEFSRLHLSANRTIGGRLQRGT